MLYVPQFLAFYLSISSIYTYDMYHCGYLDPGYWCSIMITWLMDCRRRFRSISGIIMCGPLFGLHGWGGQITQLVPGSFNSVYILGKGKSFIILFICCGILYLVTSRHGGLGTSLILYHAVNIQVVYLLYVCKGKLYFCGGDLLTMIEVSKLVHHEVFLWSCLQKYGCILTPLFC